MTSPPTSQDPARGLLLLYVGLTLLSLNGLFAKLIPLDAFSMTQLRSIIAIGGFYLFCRLFRMPLRVQSFKQLLGIYGLGLVMGVHWHFFSCHADFNRCRWYSCPVQLSDDYDSARTPVYPIPFVRTRCLFRSPRAG